MKKWRWVEPILVIGLVISAVTAITHTFCNANVEQNYLDYAIFMSQNDGKCARLFYEATDDGKLTYHEFSRIRRAWDEKQDAEKQNQYAKDMANARSSLYSTMEKK